MLTTLWLQAMDTFWNYPWLPTTFWMSFHILSCILVWKHSQETSASDSPTPLLSSHAFVFSLHSHPLATWLATGSHHALPEHSHPSYPLSSFSFISSHLFLWALLQHWLQSPLLLHSLWTTGPLHSLKVEMPRVWMETAGLVSFSPWTLVIGTLLEWILQWLAQCSDPLFRSSLTLCALHWNQWSHPLGYNTFPLNCPMLFSSKKTQLSIILKIFSTVTCI